MRWRKKVSVLDTHEKIADFINFVHAKGNEEYYVFRVLHRAYSGQLVDLAFTNRRLGGEIKVLQGFPDGQANDVVLMPVTNFMYRIREYHSTMRKQYSF